MNDDFMRSERETIEYLLERYPVILNFTPRGKLSYKG
jgi:hypothetical protein